MITNIRHTGIVVKDMEAAIRFYGDLLGMKVMRRMDESGAYIDNMTTLQNVRVTTVKLAAPDGQLIELLAFRSHQSAVENRRSITNQGLTHIAFTVDDLDRAYAALTKAGVIFNAPPQLSPDGYAKVTFCKDPEGNYLELVEVLKNG